jgi:hypothetical protein
MSRLKRSSASLDKAKTRLLAIKAIDPNLSLGEGLTATNYETLAGGLEAALNNYNTELAQVDIQLNNIVAMEDQLDALSERILQGVGVKYGYDSNQYEQAGGTRKSERHYHRRTTTTKTGDANPAS